MTTPLPKKMLITGANGLLGRELTAHFLAKGCQVKALLRPGKEKAFAKQFPQAEIALGDVLDLQELKEALADVDAVIHCAALIDFSANMKKELMAVNVGGTSNLVNLCLEHFPHCYVCFVSSIAAIGRGLSTSVSEETEWESSPLNSQYAISKHHAEMEVFRAVAEGLKAFVVNPSVILGKNDWTKSSSQLLKYVWDEKKYYTNGLINLVDARDVAKGIELAFLRNVENERIILNGATLSYKDFFGKVATALGKKAPHVEVSPFSGNMARIGSWLKSLFTGKKPLITKETLRTSFSKFSYSSEKSKSLLGLQYTAIDDTLAWLAAYYKPKASKKEAFSELPS